MGGVDTVGRGGVDRRAQGDLAQVVDLILDKGLVIDVYAKISVIGLELITIQARIVVASVDTYLRYAEAVGRLDQQQSGGGSGLGALLGGGSSGSGSSKGKPKGRKRAIAAGVLEGGKEWLDELREERRAERKERG